MNLPTSICQYIQIVVLIEINVASHFIKIDGPSMYKTLYFSVHVDVAQIVIVDYSMILYQCYQGTIKVVPVPSNESHHLAAAIIH